jgi:hypothetical protein
VPAPAKPAAEGEQPPADSEMKPEEQKQEQPQQEYEIKKKNKKTTTQLTYDTSNYAIPPNIRKQFRQLEDTLFTEDQSILEFKATKNELESFLVEMKNEEQKTDQDK